MPSAEDKRQQHRIPVELWIEVESNGELYFQRATNLSKGGAYFDNTFPLPVGTRVQLKFELPGEPDAIACEGEIVNAKGLGMGVQFKRLADSDQKRIDRLVALQKRGST